MFLEGCSISGIQEPCKLLANNDNLYLLGSLSKPHNKRRICRLSMTWDQPLVFVWPRNLLPEKLGQTRFGWPLQS